MKHSILILLAIAASAATVAEAQSPYLLSKRREMSRAPAENRRLVTATAVRPCVNVHCEHG
jgi:hypothetical protein